MKPYRISLLIFLRVYARTSSTVGSHSLIPIFSEVKYVPLLIVVHTLDDLRSDQRTFCDNSFERYHVVKGIRAESSRIAGELSEASDVGTVVHLIHQLATYRATRTLLLTTSSDDSLAGLLGSATTMFLSAWSKAWEKSKGVDNNLSSLFSSCLPG